MIYFCGKDNAHKMFPFSGLIIFSRSNTKKMNRYFFTVLITFSFLFNLKANAQYNEIDSLWKIHNKASEDTLKIKTLIEIGNVYMNFNPDSSILFFDKALEMTKNQKISKKNENDVKRLNAEALLNIGNANVLLGNYDTAIVIIEKSIDIYSEIEDQAGKALALTKLGIDYWYMGLYDNAIKYYREALSISIEINDELLKAKCFNNIGILHTNKGDFDSALVYFLKALEINEKLGVKKEISACLMNIGAVHKYQGNNETALEYYFKSLEIDTKLNDRWSMAVCYNNIGVVYMERDSIDKAIEYYTIAMDIFEELGDLNTVSDLYSNLGFIYQKQEDYKKAEDTYWESVRIKTEIKDEQGLSESFQYLSDLYIKLDSVTNDHSYLKKALEASLNSYDYANKINALYFKNKAVGNLYMIYAKMGDYKKAYDYAVEYIANTDLMFTEEKTKSIREMTTKYETEKKQLLIDAMEKQKLLDDKKIQNQRIIISSFVIGLLLILVFSTVILFILSKLKAANKRLSSQNIEIKEQNTEILLQKEEIMAQRDEIETQKFKIEKLYNTALEQKYIVEKQKQRIDDSIKYAQRIQAAMMPPTDLFSSVFADYFILFKPKDVVSGDFFFLKQYKNYIFLAAADCTGHGVPGAMMSMLSIAILNELLKEPKITDSAQLINQMREKIKFSLKQSDGNDEQLDGLDICFATIDTNTNTLDYTGAYNPLWIFRDNELIELAADRMPVSYYILEKPFTNKTIQLKKNDILYLFSDGYSDQLGGEHNTKFSVKRFKTLLGSICKLEFEEQKNQLEAELKTWSNQNVQLDDILIIGTKI